MRLKTLLKDIVNNSIIFYHNYLSSLMLCRCRYYPSCSEYTLRSIEHRGLFLGLLKGIARILRCNPFFAGGYDPYIAKSKKQRARYERGTDGA